ncbi:hypothetical protein EDB83DRAFT_2516981 [Lactarius deliciosus]|nr:hypothetical protein EDB83DRAFT_2516981 [Lactarius deliciosus]
MSPALALATDAQLVITKTSKAALDIAHFFTDVDSPNPGKGVQRACTLCIEKYGNDKQKTQEKTLKNVPNYFYMKSTANNNLHHHLTTKHGSEYDAAVLKFKWNYKLSTQSGGVSIPKDTSNVHLEVLPFSPVTLLEYLVRFIITGDHSRHIIKTLEFQQLCLVLCKSLVSTDIPGHDKMREAIINHWQGSFEVLKLDLAVV